jgi:hypothetical protein
MQSKCLQDDDKKHNDNGGADNADEKMMALSLVLMMRHADGCIM